MTWNIGLEVRDINLWRLLELQQRAAKKAYLRKVLPCATDSELEGFL